MTTQPAKPFLSRRAIRLLRKVQKHIREEPLRFDMNLWRSGFRDDDLAIPHCGTVGCIGGWLEVLGNGATSNADLKAWGDEFKDAFTLLCPGANEEGKDSVSRAIYDLFYEFSGRRRRFDRIWKGENVTRGMPAEQVETACRVIDRFIARYGPTAA